jgi:hypothetical protein
MLLHLCLWWNGIGMLLQEASQRFHHTTTLRRWLPRWIHANKVQERTLHLSVLGLMQRRSSDCRTVLWVAVLLKVKVGKR